MCQTKLCDYIYIYRDIIVINRYYSYYITCFPPVEVQRSTWSLSHGPGTLSVAQEIRSQKGMDWLQVLVAGVCSEKRKV